MTTIQKLLEDYGSRQMQPARHPVRVVVFVLVGIGWFAWSVTSCAMKRQEVALLIRDTPEFRCLAGPDHKSVYIRWGSLTESRSAYFDIPIGTIVEKKDGTNCIPDGDAVTFAFMPDGKGESRSLVRIEGWDPKVVLRGANQWYDVTDASGTERWRSDGDGFRKISP